MKKGLALLVAVFMLVLVMGAACACAEDELLKEFEPVWTNAVELSAEEWFSLEETRALLTVFLTTDYFLAEEDIGIMTALAGRTYVSLSASGSGLMVIYYIDGQAYTISYQPEEGTAQCLGPMDYTEDDVERVLTSMQALGAEYEANSDQKIIEMEYLILGKMMEDAE